MIKVCKKNYTELFTLNFGKNINEYLIAATFVKNGSHVNNLLILYNVIVRFNAL